jgi:hypothetical protein
MVLSVQQLEPIEATMRKRLASRLGPKKQKSYFSLTTEVQCSKCMAVRFGTVACSWFDAKQRCAKSAIDWRYLKTTKATSGRF